MMQKNIIVENDSQKTLTYYTQVFGIATTTDRLKKAVDYLRERYMLTIPNLETLLNIDLESERPFSLFNQLIHLLNITFTFDSENTQLNVISSQIG